MRIKILQIPRGACIDGVQLDRFAPGQQYELGQLLASCLLSEGWAEPVAFDAAPLTPEDDDDKLPAFEY